MNSYLYSTVNKYQYGNEALANLGGSTATIYPGNVWSIMEASNNPERLPLPALPQLPGMSTKGQSELPGNINNTNPVDLTTRPPVTPTEAGLTGEGNQKLLFQASYLVIAILLIALGVWGLVK